MSDSDALDLRGLKCPLPVMRTRKHLRDLAIGARLRIETTDPLAAIDIPHFCLEDGHRLVSSQPIEGGHSFVIEKA
ncbi:sulfurtransferase TusA family protein [Hoeflea sp.]|uniref:sulfurtransferase TusA family protein n=1 Tax=Hoeflea sp. TaxID=1940281 RepID=UPI00199652E2|nr:sulfurtransferase TusA family protein [Hoeflea sp.]MBC7284282.1 sulfurtransferase TusA family protein [Hoeflea sp.]